jgi:pimeloyl-ACP methyl ester carboxylesterase
MATFVLIPGAGGLAWEWHRLEPELRSLGQDVIPIDLPAGDGSAGLPEYADTVTSAIGDRAGVVLVAQSYGGFTAPLVCERARVDLLVFLNAMIPKPGETFGEWWSNTGQGPAQREYARQLGLTPAQLDDDRVVYYHDLPDELVEQALRLDADQSSTPLGQPWPLERMPDIPLRVISGRDDRMFPAAFQRRVAQERLGITPDTIPGGHMVALSNPAGLAELLDRYAAAELRPA